MFRYDAPFDPASAADNDAQVCRIDVTASARSPGVSPVAVTTSNDVGLLTFEM